MTQPVGRTILRLFRDGPIAITRRYADGSNLRRKGLVRSERLLGDYWRWRHELTPAGRAERERVMEAARG